MKQQGLWPAHDFPAEARFRAAAARVTYPAALLCCRLDAPSACRGVIDFLHKKGYDKRNVPVHIMPHPVCFQERLVCGGEDEGGLQCCI